MNNKIVETLYQLGDQCLQKKSFDKAIDAYQEIIKLQPEDGSAYIKLGNALKLQGKWSEAERAYLKGLAISPQLLSGYVNLGDVDQKQGKLKAAIQSYLTAISIQPSHISAYHRLGDLLKQAGNLEEAQLCYYVYLPLRILQEFYPPWPEISAKLIATDKITPIFPGTEVILSPPKHLPQQNHPEFQRQHFPAPGTFVITLDHSRAWGDLFTTAVFSPNNELIPECSSGSPAVIATSQRLPPATVLKGITAFLSIRGGSANYFHWMIDFLPRIHLLRQSGVKFEEIDQFVIPRYRTAYHRQTLEILGIPAAKIIESHHYPHIHCDHLIAPSIHRTDALVTIPQWSCEFLRQSFLDSITNLNHRQYPKRIYISRGNAKVRKIINEAELIEFLSSRGFQTIQLENLEFRQQVAVMAAAKIVIAPHGAGLTNLVFCHPGTQVIEIFAPEAVPVYFWMISHLIGLDYSYLLGEDIHSLEFRKQYPNLIHQLPPKALVPSHEHIWVNLNNLKQLL